MNKNTKEIKNEKGAKNAILDVLFANRDLEYRKFQSKLIPNIEEASVIGVRTPVLRKFAKELAGGKKSTLLEGISSEELVVLRDTFLSALPHTYFDENQLHGFLISEMKDYEKCMQEVERFLPYIDNWATCDQMSPKVFRKHLDDLDPNIEKWISSEHPYTVRFGIEMRMSHFLEEEFKIAHVQRITDLRREEYYVKMMVAWYVATALAKQYDKTISFIEKPCMDPWTHNKAIQKAIESYRITKEQKDYLRTLKVKK